jgi:hypothetical protein
VRRFIYRKAFEWLGRRYDYDVGYLLYLLAHSPKACYKFISATAMSRHRECVPELAMYAARIAATLGEDCGPCTQILVQQALEARIPATQVEAMLTRCMDDMDPAAVIAYQFAEAVVTKEASVSEARDRVRARWGERGVVDLAVAIQGTRLFPMMKSALGFDQACRQIAVGNRAVTVTK